MGRLMMQVAGIEEGDQNVDVEESNAHSSSRNEFTRARSGRLAPAPAAAANGLNSGTPLRIWRSDLLLRAVRTSSDTMWPTLVRL